MIGSLPLKQNYKVKIRFEVRTMAGNYTRARNSEHILSASTFVPSSLQHKTYKEETLEMLVDANPLSPVMRNRDYSNVFASGYFKIGFISFLFSEQL